MKGLILLFTMVNAFTLFAQKNVVPVTSSPLTGIRLPSGTKQDNRFMSTFSASSLLISELEAPGLAFEAVEVFTIPTTNGVVLNYDSVVKQLSINGWSRNQRTESTASEKASWITKDNTYVAMYFSVTRSGADLYFGKVTGELPSKASPQEKVDPSTTNISSAVGASTTTVTLSPPVSYIDPATPDSLIGTWYTTSSVNTYTTGLLNFGYIKRQFTFSADHRYSFYSKVFDMSMKEIILKKEKGRFSYTGNKLVLNSETTTIETWSKKEGVDQWGTKLSSTSLPSENTTYGVTMHYFSGIGELNLILQPQNKNQTQREGAFATNTNFPNSYLYSVPPDNSYLISLPEP